MDAMMSGQIGQPAAWMMDHTFGLLPEAKGLRNVAWSLRFHSASAIDAVTAAPASTIIQNTNTHSMKIGTAASAP